MGNGMNKAECSDEENHNDRRGTRNYEDAITNEDHLQKVVVCFDVINNRNDFKSNNIKSFDQNKVTRNIYNIQQDINNIRCVIDEFSLFGEEVALKIRNISSTYVRTSVQNRINNLLMEAELGFSNFYKERLKQLQNDVSHKGSEEETSNSKSTPKLSLRFENNNENNNSSNERIFLRPSFTPNKTSSDKLDVKKKADPIVVNKKHKHSRKKPKVLDIQESVKSLKKPKTVDMQTSAISLLMSYVMSSLENSKKLKMVDIQKPDEDYKKVKFLDVQTSIEDPRISKFLDKKNSSEGFMILDAQESTDKNISEYIQTSSNVRDYYQYHHVTSDFTVSTFKNISEL